MTEASRPVGAPLRWLNSVGSAMVQRGSTATAPTPAARSRRRIPSRMSRPGVFATVVHALPGRCALDILLHHRRHLVAFPGGGRTEQRADTFRAAHRARSSCAGPLPRCRSGRLHGPHEPLPPRPPVVGKQYRYTVRGQDDQASPGSRDHGIGGGTASATGPSTTDTFLLCICSIHTSEAGGRPIPSARRRLFAATAAGSSPTWSPRLKESYGGCETLRRGW